MDAGANIEGGGERIEELDSESGSNTASSFQRARDDIATPSYKRHNDAASLDQNPPGKEMHVMYLGAKGWACALCDVKSVK